MLACSPAQIQNLLLDLRLQPAPGRDKLLKCRIVPTKFRQPFAHSSQSKPGKYDVSDETAGAIPAASTFSVQASTSDSTHQDTCKFSDCDGVLLQDQMVVFCQQATVCGGSRPPRATESATGPRVIDPALAAVVAAWPDLPATVQAGILAMVGDRAVLKNSI